MKTLSPGAASRFLVWSTRFAAGAVLLLAGLCLTAPQAKADLGPPDLPIMETLAAPVSQGGYGWAAALGWNLNNNPCPTTGIPNWAGVTCNKNGRVVIIVGACSTTLINGPLPALLTQLTALTSFDLRNCGLYGPIPDVLQTMTQLTRLRLDNNALSGPAPAWLAAMPNLGYLVLGPNRLTGPVPDFPSSASTVVGLDGNFLSGDIPAGWTRFDRSLSYNYFNTPFPAPCSPATDTNRCGPNRLVSLPTVVVSKVSGDGQWTPAGSAFLSPLSVTVTDLSNNPVSGATVTFSGPGIDTATAITGNNGMASATVTANSTVGGNTVTAAVGLTGMTSFGLTVGDQPSCSGNIQVSSIADSGPGTLREALADVCPGGTVDLTPIAGQTIALSAYATSYNFSGRLYIGEDVSINGQGVTISGSGNTRIFFVQGGNVSMTNLTLTNGLGQGGSSQYGGPAAGLGGAIFQNGGTLTLSSVVFSNNSAQGGTTDTSGNMNGGGFGANSSGGDLGGSNGAGDGAGGVLDGMGDPGGFGGGGGYGNTFDQPVGGSAGGWGGVGGFGASMGSSAAVLDSTNHLIQNANNPFANGYGAVLGGGAGFGGAIFTRAGTLNLTGDAFSGNSAAGAAGAQGKGGSLFIYNGASLNLDAATTFNGSVAAAAGAPGIGYSEDMIYDAGNTCPGADTADLCGVVSNNALTGPASAAYQSTFQVTAASNSTATPMLSMIAGPCSISGTTVLVTGANGTCVVQASWAANGIYPASTAIAKVNLTPASSLNACVAPPAGLAAWWKAEGNANDVTAGYNGTAGGDVGYASGKVGQAFSFDGTQSPYVALPAGAFPAQPSGSPFSFEGWFKAASGGVILGQQPSAPYGFPNGWSPAIYVGTDGKLYSEMFYYGAVNPIVSSYAVNDNQWHHVAVTYDGATETAYLDGAVVGSISNYTQAANGSPLSYELGTGYTAGAWPAGISGWYTFNGLIDEATVYSSVLQPSDILNIISAGSYGKCTSQSLVSGDNQSGVTTRTLPQPFIVQTNGTQSSVTFSVVANGGAGGTFTPINGFPAPVLSNGNTQAIVMVDASNNATSPQLTANSVAGSFTVTAFDGENTTVFNVTTAQCAANPTVTAYTDTGAPGELRAAVNTACTGATIDLTQLGGKITLASRLRIDDSLTINGPGASGLAIDGGGSTRLFFIGNGNVSISNLTLQNGLGKGGDTGGVGGGGAGMGGAIFQNGGNLSIASVAFSGNTAQGGGAANGGSGGGGFSGLASGSAGGGGGDLFGIGGSTGGGNGGPGAGGGTAPFDAGNGGNGGFGGGGGYAGVESGNGGNGGFGAGGGVSPSGTAGTPGYGANAQSGAGFGGAIFEYAGTLTLLNDSFSGNQAIGANSQTGQGKGGAIFIYSGATASATNTTFGGSVAAAAGQPGSGSSPAPYATGATCPTEDDVNICGVLTIPVTVSTSVPGLAVTVDNSAVYTTPQTFTWIIGQQHTLTVTSPQSITAGTQYVFANWSDGASALSDSITVTSATTSYTANFQTQYLLTVNANPSAGGMVGGGGYFNAGATPTVTAAANRYYQFSNWTGSVANVNSASTTLNALAAPQTVVANFAFIPATATYIGADSATEGNWVGTYGTDGGWIANDASVTLPAYATLTFNGSATSTWVANSSDPRALEISGTAAGRIASTNYAKGSFNFTVNITDGNSHQLSLYLLDWDSTVRAESITLSDANTGMLLSTQSYAGFHNGEYASWTISGSVKVTVTQTSNAGNAVLSGIFFGSPATVTSTASYLKLDSSTQGNWIGRYGTDGNLIASEAAVMPAYANVTFNGANTSTWKAETSDVRALQDSAAAPLSRIASTYYASGSFTFNVSISDGQTHQLALYLLDWDTTVRTETITLRDAATHALLDSRSYTSFHNGVYAVWSIGGTVLVEVTQTGPENAVVSGIFLGGPAAVGSQAGYLGTDSSTQGTWQGVYGKDGAFMANDAAVAAPAYATLSLPGSTPYTWLAKTSDVRALEISSTSTNRMASTYFAPSSFAINLSITDGNTHAVSLYLLDWDTTERSETITIRDAASGAILDSESYAGFHNGLYARWNISGTVVVEVTQTGPENAVVSGVFFN